MPQPQNTKSNFDETDAEIIRLLTGNARISMSDLAREIGMSPPSATERVRRLEAAGVIRGYTIDIDLGALGFEITALVRIKPRSGQLHIVEKFLRDEPRFVSCDKVTGEDCFVARLCLRSITELDGVLDPLHQRAETNTSIVTASPIQWRIPSLRPETTAR
ncbi:MAG: Lrp/AsnC family transcriptional regulator [Hyphomicrobiaceae bacterium]